jgi:hypothetical protein
VVIASQINALDPDVQAEIDAYVGGVFIQVDKQPGG